MPRSKTRARAARPAALAVQARRLHGLLVGLSRLRPMRDPLATAAAELHLTPAQIHVVLWLGTDGPLTMGDLARRLAVTEKTITGVIDRLERDGLVQRARHPADRRVVHVRLSPGGARLHRRIDEGIASKLTGLLALLEAADRQRLVRMVEKLTARLAAEEAT